MISRKEIKQQAQDNLMSAMQIAFLQAHDDHASSDLISEMSSQMERVEKLFGYDPGSWQRGC